MTQSFSSPSAAAGQAGGATYREAFRGGLAALEMQAAGARAALPQFAQIERTSAAWLPALDVATDAGDLKQLAGLAADAPTEFAAGLASERVATFASGGLTSV